MSCPYLEYRDSNDDHEFDHDRPFCTVAETFVSPMRADICNARHGFDYEQHCEIFPGLAAEATSPGSEETVPETTD